MSSQFERMQPWNPSVISEFDASIGKLTHGRGVELSRSRKGGLLRSRTLQDTEEYGRISIASWREPLTKYITRAVIPLGWGEEPMPIGRQRHTIFEIPELFISEPDSSATSTTYAQLIHENKLPIGEQIIYRISQRIDKKIVGRSATIGGNSGPSLSEVLREEGYDVRTTTELTPDIIDLLTERHMLPEPDELEFAIETLRIYTQ